ncbi:MAG: hypothetical protein II695_00540 [Oscillospiraceae bacterium]|nr:hypothetical protein [Oscillospiraceae bacterium]
MEMNEMCLVRMVFSNTESAREFMQWMLDEKLVAYAISQRAATYKLEMTADEDGIVGYTVDENAIGIASDDTEDDILLEIYTGKHLAGKIDDIIESHYESVIDSYIVIPVLSASRRIRVAVRNLMMYHQKKNLS